MDSVTINIIEQIDDISINVTNEVSNVDITVLEQPNNIEITATNTYDQVVVNVTQSVAQVTINVVEGTSGGGGAVDSVNGQTGVVVLSTSDLEEDADHNYVTDAEKVVIGNTSGTNTGDKADGAIDHNALLNTHNLTSDIDHDQITNTHNLTTDIDHNQLTNYEADEHFTQSAISIPASQISDFDTEVSNNTDVADNTSARHDAVTVTDTTEIDLTLTGQDIQASIKTASIDETKLDTSVNDSLNLADSATQPGDLGDLALLDTVGTSEIDTDAVTSNELADTIEIPNLTLDVVETNLSTLSAGVAVAANFLNNSFLQVTLTDNCTITVSNLKEGVNTLMITQPAAFKTITKSGWGTSVDNNNDVAEVNSAISIVQFIHDGTNTYYVTNTVGA